MRKLFCLCLCALPWTAWARPDTNLGELQSIDRRGKTWKGSVAPARDNARWLADYQPGQFTLENVSAVKGVWYSGPKPGVAYIKLPAQFDDHILSIEVAGSSQQGAVRLEGGGQEIFSFTNPGNEARLDRKFNLSISSHGELRWFLAPNTQVRLQRIRIYQLK